MLLCIHLFKEVLIKTVWWLLLIFTNNMFFLSVPSSFPLALFILWSFSFLWASIWLSFFPNYTLLVLKSTDFCKQVSSCYFGVVINLNGLRTLVFSFLQIFLWIYGSLWKNTVLIQHYGLRLGHAAGVILYLLQSLNMAERVANYTAWSRKFE